MRIERVKETCDEIIDVVSSFFVGERLLLDKVLAAALANGHILFEDYPGLGKTLLAKCFAKVTGCTWGRVQFTPDLMPTDIVGTKVWRMDTSEFTLERGPVFTNILLADEINRSPPKVQSALLECMEERQVTIEGETLALEAPFFVMATQNPIELEGTYPLPEAQMDRFLLRLSTGYVSSVEKETEILKRRVSWQRDDPVDLVEPLTSNEVFRDLQDTVEKSVHIDEQILAYISRIVRRTRESPLVDIGSSPRGGLSLLKVSRAYAAINGRDFVIPDDVKTFANDVLGHRIILKMEYAVGERVDPGQIINEIIEEIEPPRDITRR
ncbi:MAG: MoxR family ATPase [Candidatus Bathyarchaeota archaeon]|jgi:MoxR-like ATPase|nr:MoxR family ATPase [Candidatus Bathyarchaeota archaeon]